MTDKSPPKKRSKKISPAEIKRDNTKPLHKALGPAADDFGTEIKPLGKELGQLTVKQFAAY